METELKYLTELSKSSENAERERRKTKLIETGIYGSAKIARHYHEKEFLPVVRQTQPYLKKIGEFVHSGFIRRTFGDTIGNELSNRLKEAELLLEKTHQVRAALDEIANLDPYKNFGDDYERDKWAMRMRDLMGNHCGSSRLLDLKKQIEDHLEQAIRNREYAIKIGRIKAEDLPAELTAIVQSAPPAAEPRVDAEFDR